MEKLTERSGGCYLGSPMQREVEKHGDDKEPEIVRRYSLHNRLSETTWSKEETWDESGRTGKIRVRSMGPATGRVISQKLANGLQSQSWYDDSSVGLDQKRSSFKLSKGATPYSYF